MEAPPTKQISSRDSLTNKSFSDFNALLSLLIGDSADNLNGQLASDSGNPKKAATDLALDKRKETQLDPNTSLGLVPASQVVPQPQPMPDASLTAQSRTAAHVPVHQRGGSAADQLPLDLPNPTSDPQAQQILGDLAGVRKAAQNLKDPMAFAAQLTESSKTDKNTQQATPASRPAVADLIDRQGGSNSPKPKGLLQPTARIPIQTKDTSGGSQSSSDDAQQFQKSFGPGKDVSKGATSSNLPMDGGANPGYDGVMRPLEATPRQDTSAKAAQPPTPAQAEQLESKSEINQTLRPQPAREIALRLSGNDTGQLDLRITERAGKVQVSVRTSDEDLSSSLQSNLGDLVGRLEKKGFATETWTPDNRAGHIAGPETANNSSDSGNPSQPGGHSQNGDPRHGQQKSRPQWVDELESGSPGKEEGETNDQ